MLSIKNCFRKFYNRILLFFIHRKKRSSMYINNHLMYIKENICIICGDIVIYKCNTYCKHIFHKQCIIDTGVPYCKECDIVVKLQNIDMYKCMEHYEYWELLREYEKEISIMDEYIKHLQ